MIVKINTERFEDIEVDFDLYGYYYSDSYSIDLNDILPLKDYRHNINYKSKEIILMSNNRQFLFQGLNIRISNNKMTIYKINNNDSKD